MAKAKLKKVDVVEVRGPRMGDVTSPEFQEAMAALMNQALTVKASIALLKTHDAVAAAQKTYEDVRQRLVIKHGELTDEGKVKLSEDGSKYVLKDPAAFDNEYKELLSQPVEIPRIPVSYIEDCKLSPAMLSTLLKTVLNPEN